MPGIQKPINQKLIKVMDSSLVATQSSQTH